MTTRIGVVGGGQLGRMMALAGARLDLSFVFLDPSEDCCAAAFGEHIRAEYDDQDALAELASKVDLVTFEFENVPDSAVELLANTVPVYPRANCLQLSRDRLSEKTMLNELGIETAPFADVLSQESLEEAIGVVGVPAILKTRTLGYDGKGQKVIRSNNDVAGSFEALDSVPCILEGFVPFDRELSIISVRSVTGEIAHYALTTNAHLNGVLDTSVPGLAPELQAAAEEIAARIITHLDYVGVLAVEFFDVAGRLVVNEIAPRVHNSGHWTIEGSFCSQFENHLRAITALPLGATEMVADCAMVNFIGSVPEISLLSAVPGCSIHHYGKASRAGRKVGHATVLAKGPLAIDPSLRRVMGLRGSIIHSKLRSQKDVPFILSVGRDENKLSALNNGDQTLYWAGDAHSAGFVDVLREHKINLVIHTAGPFQEQDYSIANAAIAAGANYCDLSDCRHFVRGISSLDESAKRAGVFVLSGCSSVPTLSSAVIDHFRRLFSKIDHIDFGITSSSKMPGVSTIRGVLQYAGKHIEQFENGDIKRVHGWQDLTLHRFEGLGSRLLANVDVPDMDIFPARYGAHTVRFQAGAGLKMGTLANFGAAYLARFGLVENASVFADWLHKVGQRFEWLGDKKKPHVHQNLRSRA